MASIRASNMFDTPPRQQAGGNLSGFQSPYTPPTPAQRPPPAPIFATPARQVTTTTTTTTTTTPSSQLQQTSSQQQSVASSGGGGQMKTRGPETPKVGGKWTHPALAGIEKEARKFMFGEEELKRLVANTSLLIAMWWVTRKADESDVFEGLVRSIKYSPRLSFGLQLIAWSFRALFLFNIVTSLLPLFRPRSRPLTTIPLTPAQRELIGLDKTDITPIAKSANETITPPRYKASPSGTRPSPRLTPGTSDFPRSVSLGTPSPAQRALTGTTTSSFSTPVQQRPRSSSSLNSGRRFASGVSGSPLGMGGSPLTGASSMLESPTSRKASMEVFFRG